MRCASAYGFGEHPEDLAWRRLSGWARPRGLLDDRDAHPIFGFNNPYPTSESPNYGYEFWIKVGQEVVPHEDIRIVEFMGGTYAMTRCEVRGHPEKISKCWQELATRCKEAGHRFGKHPALEGFWGTPEDLDNLVVNLYCPIIE